MNTPMQVINPAGAPPHFGNLCISMDICKPSYNAWYRDPDHLVD